MRDEWCPSVRLHASCYGAGFPRPRRYAVTRGDIVISVATLWVA
jgi:hypothetical protein